MAKKYNFEQLKSEMIERSHARDWDQAKLEWDLEVVFRSGEEQSCLCGHEPILQICVLRNKLTDKAAEVGNVCVERFLGMRSRRVFSALKRIREDENRSMNKATIEMFRRLNVIAHADAIEYLAFYRKRTRITDDQKSLRRAVNNDVLAYVDRRAIESATAFRSLGGRPATKGAPPATEIGV